MKKTIIFYLVAIIFVEYTFSQNRDFVYGSEIDGVIRMSDKNISLSILDYQYNGTYEYNIETKSNIHFLKYGGITNIISSSSKLIYLLNSNGSFYDGVGYNENGRNGRHINLIGPAKIYTSSSFLIENNTKYEPKNLSSININLPWVEGSKCDGGGEYVEMEWEYDVNGIIVVNGFTSFNKPELYLHNNRAKKIRISINDYSENFIYELEDTSNPQIIQLPKNGNKIKVEIIDVYKGSRWNDTCISMIQGISSDAGDIFFKP